MDKSGRTLTLTLTYDDVPRKSLSIKWSGRRDSNPRPLEPHKETGVFGTIWQGLAQPGTTRHHELESICGRGFAGDEGAAQAGTGRHTIFSPGLPPGLPPRYHVSENSSRWCVRRLREDEGAGEPQFGGFPRGKAEGEKDDGAPKMSPAGGPRAEEGVGGVGEASSARDPIILAERKMARCLQ